MAICDRQQSTGTTQIRNEPGEHVADTIATELAVALTNKLRGRLEELFAENVAAKVFRTAQYGLQDNRPPTAYPEWVPQCGEDAGQYKLREADFWTCGFFPGTLYLLLERMMRYPQVFPVAVCDKDQIYSQLLVLARSWAAPIYDMASRVDTHDMGFITEPSLRMEWELFGTSKSKAALVVAAESLASRYNEKVKAIRSWDGLWQNGREISSMTEDFLVIIDSLMNLDLLFYVGHHQSSKSLVDKATAHACTVAVANLRRQEHSPTAKSPFEGVLYSTFHVVNLSPMTGKVKEKMTAQGFADNSTWARGQSWGILGYAQTYQWTRDRSFLDLACGLAEYFLLRLENSPPCVEEPLEGTKAAFYQRGRKTRGRYVPLWDFDAPVNEAAVLRDSSAGVIAANGMLLLHQAFSSLGQHDHASWYLESALKIVEDTLAFSLAVEKTRFSTGGRNSTVCVEDVTENRFDALLKHATANYNASDKHRYWNHGVVYGDYYLVEFGNKLLRMGLL